jgi:hypothetical protein
MYWNINILLCVVQAAEATKFITTFPTLGASNCVRCDGSKGKCAEPASVSDSLG